MEITKAGTQSVQVKMRNAEFYLKKAAVIHGFLSPTCSKIARNSVKVRRTRLLPLVQIRAQEQAFN